MADTIPSEREIATVEILIVNDYYLDIVMPQRIEVHPGLYLLSSKLGWILTGRMNEENSDKSEFQTNSSMLILSYEANNQNILTSIDNIMQRKPDLNDFWNVESIGIVDKEDSLGDKMAMEQFKKNLKFENGRYYVTWPWKDNNTDIPTNKELAKGRLNSCVKKLIKAPELLQKYDDIIQDQLNKGIIEKIDETMNVGKIHYIPHHAVITPQKTTTKVRIVYDASAKTKREFSSLNESLYRGPVLLEDLCGLLMRFRTNKIAIVSDIEKAFLMVGLQEQDRNVTRCFWLKDANNPSADYSNVQEYRFSRVPFGVISSTFLLAATVQAHLERYGTNRAQKIKRDIYVDNVITGTDTTAEAIELYMNSKRMFKDASMNLREWISNSSEVMQFIPEDDRASTEDLTILGHKWDCIMDTISIKTPALAKIENEITKRTILQCVASVFDPMGLFAPVTLRGKLILQKLWSQNMNWDDEVHDDSILREWKQHYSELQSISDHPINRCISVDNKTHAEYKLLCFCDASTKAYAAAVYLYQSSNNERKVDLLFAKSRLATIKGMTVPRLEIMAVVMGVRCLKYVKTQLQIQTQESILWTDSQCVLGWLNSNKTLPVFVQNRVKEIKKHVETKIGYINTSQNPADLATRETTLNNLVQSSLWWHGSSNIEEEIVKVLGHENTNVCTSVTCIRMGDNSNSKSQEIIDSHSQRSDPISSPLGIDYQRFSSISKLIRVTAYALRFIKNINKPENRKVGPLSSSELENAELFGSDTFSKNTSVMFFLQLITGSSIIYKNN